MIYVKGGTCRINAGDTNTISVPLDGCENDVTSWDDWTLYCFGKIIRDNTDEEAEFQKFSGTGIVTSGDNALIDLVYEDTFEHRGKTILCEIRGENITTGVGATFNKGFSVVVGKSIVQHTDASIDIYTSSPPSAPLEIVETTPITGASLVHPVTARDVLHEVTPDDTIAALTWPLVASELVKGRSYSLASTETITALTITFAGEVRGTLPTTAEPNAVYSLVCISATGDGIIRVIA